MGNCHRKTVNGQDKARDSNAANGQDNAKDPNAAKDPQISTETHVTCKTWPDQYESAAIYMEEGKNHSPFKYHPTRRETVKAYRCIQIRPILV